MSDNRPNIEAYVRIRPLSLEETKQVVTKKSPTVTVGVPDAGGMNKEVIVVEDQASKSFHSDGVFGKLSEQNDVFDGVATPLIQEALTNGNKCNIFAYGPTGSGKTFTMVGQPNVQPSSWENDSFTGLIPRTLHSVFDWLENNCLDFLEYFVSVSYVEIYHNYFFDLIGGTVHFSLDEMGKTDVFDKTEALDLFFEGVHSAYSSRSANASRGLPHTIFTVEVSISPNYNEGGEQELIKVAKINLIELAGNEHISYSGLVDRPARDVKSSLEHLDIVITKLLKREPDIPLQGSMLTEALIESLGGRTKTTFIATISPMHDDLQHTLMTLDFAHRIVTTRSELPTGQLAPHGNFAVEICNSCEAGYKAVGMCKQCGYICSLCHLSHQRLKIFKKHEAFSPSDNSVGGIQMLHSGGQDPTTQPANTTITQEIFEEIQSNTNESKRHGNFVIKTRKDWSTRARLRVDESAELCLVFHRLEVHCEKEISKIESLPSINPEEGLLSALDTSRNNLKVTTKAHQDILQGDCNLIGKVDNTQVTYPVSSGRKKFVKRFPTVPSLLEESLISTPSKNAPPGTKRTHAQMAQGTSDSESD